MNQRECVLFQLHVESEVLQGALESVHSNPSFSEGQSEAQWSGGSEGGHSVRERESLDHSSPLLSVSMVLGPLPSL